MIISSLSFLTVIVSACLYFQLVLNQCLPCCLVKYIAKKITRLYFPAGCSREQSCGNEDFTKHHIEARVSEMMDSC
jgi:hypothetical protein